MKQLVVLWSVLVLTVALVAGACVPAVAPPAAAPPAPVVAPAAVRTPPSPEEAAWQKVVVAAKKEGRVTIYSSSFVADIGQRIARDFKDQYGITVQILAGSSPILNEKIYVEQAIKQPVVDVAHSGGQGSIVELAKRGLAEPLAHVLPAVKDKEAFIVDPVYSPGGEVLSWSITYQGAAINTNLVKPHDERQFLDDLLAPRWKGQILSPDPVAGSSGDSFFYTPRFYKALDLDYYRRLAQQDLQFWAGNPREATRMVARGEYPVFLSGSTGSAAPMIAEGAPIKISTFNESILVTLGATVVLKGAPHPNAAKVFVNWLMSPQGQLAYAESASDSPLRKDVPNFLTPGARVSPKKLWPNTWETEAWLVKDRAAGTMAKIFGKKK